jgi:hypothetical protein
MKEMGKGLALVFLDSHHISYSFLYVHIRMDIHHLVYVHYNKGIFVSCRHIVW